MKAFDGVVLEIIEEVAVLSIDINSYYESRAFLYIVPRITDLDMILGI
jgi:hypothetical protein